MKYEIIEAQEVRAVYAYTWTVDADSPEEAKEKVARGDGDLSEKPREIYGDEDFGVSGFGLDREEALDDFEERV